jgi:Rps23 Pro-64 3,4-dihydroxylase Tpa1-like proline 4-hydroxylase
MNDLINNGYIVIDLKDIASEEVYNKIDKIANDLENAETPYIEDYLYEYHLSDSDIKIENLSGTDASIKIYDRSQFSNDQRRKLGNFYKKKLINKYFNVVQIFGLSDYDDEKLFHLTNQINLRVLEIFYSHVFNDISQINEKVFSRNSTKRLTVYDEFCKITRHRDGFKQDRVFAILLYLNKEWDDKNGGDLIIYDKNKNEIKISPKGLKICVLDFLQNNIEHEVLEVISGTRYTYVMFVELTENITNTDLWRKNKKSYE